jgi:hypothetical protein
MLEIFAYKHLMIFNSKAMNPGIIFQPRISVLFCFFLFIQFSQQTLTKGIKEIRRTRALAIMLKPFLQSMHVRLLRKRQFYFTHRKFAISMKTAYFYCRANTLYQIDTQWRERNAM